MQNVTITSGAQEASFSIVDKNGEEVAKGTTPDTVLLRTSSAPFEAARYIVNFDSTDQTTSSSTLLKARFSGWYFSNFIGGYFGLLGFLVIDPFTGALYSLPDESRMVAEVANEAAQ